MSLAVKAMIRGLIDVSMKNRIERNDGGTMRIKASCSWHLTDRKSKMRRVAGASAQSTEACSVQSAHSSDDPEGQQIPK